MVVRNGVETQNVTSKDFDLTSASASRVLLPCPCLGRIAAGNDERSSWYDVGRRTT